MIGTIKINSCLMFVHSFFSTSIIGAFYVFLLIDCFLRSESHGTGSSNNDDGSSSSSTSEESVGDRTVLLLLSMPFLVIFAVGCHSLHLLSMVLDEIKARKAEGVHQEMQEMPSLRS